MTPVSESQSYKNITSTTVIASSNSILAGIFVASASGSPTIKVTDESSTTNTGTIVNTFTPVAATWYPLAFRTLTGLKVTIGGTVDCTVAWSAG